MSVGASSLPRKAPPAAIHWFRKGLRLHDNPALLEALHRADIIYPLFIIDKKFADVSVMSCNRYAFLLDSLSDLDRQLRALGSRLFVARGKTEDLIPVLVKKWGVSLVTFEADESGPYGRTRDNNITHALSTSGCEVSVHCTHTLFPMHTYEVKQQGVQVKTYQSFIKLFQSLGAVRQPVSPPTLADFSGKLLDRADVLSDYVASDSSEGISVPIDQHRMSIPTLQEMGYSSSDHSSIIIGGETEALRRLDMQVIRRPDWVASFAKPDTVPK